MMRIFSFRDGRCVAEEVAAATAGLPAGAAWVDLLHPTREEELWLEDILGIDIPTREEMQAIETSSRLYRVDGGHVMTATVITNTDAAQPESAAISFVLTPRVLVTVRYADPRPFVRFSVQAQRSPEVICNPQEAFTRLVDAVVDRAADILEAVGEALGRQSREIFAPAGGHRTEALKAQLKELGRQGDIVSKVRESLVSLSRLVAFARGIDHLRQEPESFDRLATLEGDISALSDHVDFLSDKVTFLLDAMLGMISIEQNALIKLFSVVAVMFLPPTLIASVYGMNFEHMPEVDWAFAYPAVLVIMLVSMVLPYVFFRRKGWL